MLTTLIIALLVLVGVVLVMWRFASNAAAILAVAGVAAIAIWVTVVQVRQYHTQEAVDAENAAAAQPVAAPTLPPVVTAPRPMNGLTGGAAPEVAPPLPHARS